VWRNQGRQCCSGCQQALERGVDSYVGAKLSDAGGRKVPVDLLPAICDLREVDMSLCAETNRRSGEGPVQVVLECERPVAIESPDHLMPWGTRHDNSVHKRFNQKLWHIYPAHMMVKVLDLGCAGGGFVSSCINDGHLAVGLEGSDFSKRHKRAAWATIPDFLFTCDVTRPFELYLRSSHDRELLRFDVVTAWEFIEHIKKEDLPAVAANIHRHLVPGGLWILSIANHQDMVGGVELHQTVQNKAWWRQTFQSLGFVLHDQFARYFRRQFVRGERVEAETSFHLVLSNDKSRSPAVPQVESLGHSVFDLWYGSKPQKLLHKLIVG
jgi:2-polyprenyl-3-methyl-5-hydroxy-6-metoxy-1,4-benzoquinol methylase